MTTKQSTAARAEVSIGGDTSARAALSPEALEAASILDRLSERDRRPLLDAIRRVDPERARAPRRRMTPAAPRGNWVSLR